MAQTDKKPSLLLTLLKTSFTERVLIFFLVLVFVGNASQTIAIPIIFKEPRIVCTDPLTNISFECAEIVACTNKYSFYIDKVTGPHSFTADYELICEKASLKRLALSCIFMGYLIGAIGQMIYNVDSHKRKWFILGGATVMVASQFMMLLLDAFDMGFALIAWCFLTSGIGGIYLITYMYVYANEIFKGDLALIMMILLNIGGGSAGIAFALMGYFFNCNWRVLLGTCCVTTIVSVIYLSLCTHQSGENFEENNKNDDVEEETEETPHVTISFLSYFKDMWPNKVIRTNFILYTIIWTVFVMIYFVQYVEIESVGGSVYFNTILLCCLEMSSVFSAGYLTQRYSSDKLMKVLMTIVIIILLSFYIAPMSVKNASGLTVFFFIAILLLSKFSNDLINNMIYLTLPKMFTDKYAGLYVIVSRSFSRVLLIFLPSINYFIRNYFHIHPFVFYGVIYAICRYLLTYCKEVQSDGGIDELMNDAKIEPFQRAGVASGTHSIAGAIIHDDLLKKVHVDGVQLSVIRRFKQDSDSIKVGSKVFQIRKSVLDNIKTSKSMHHSKANAYELKEGLLNQKEIEVILAK